MYSLMNLVIITVLFLSASLITARTTVEKTCDFTCLHGSCSYHNCKPSPDCPGGACHFYDCVNPSCTGNNGLVLHKVHSNSYI